MRQTSRESISVGTALQIGNRRISFDVIRVCKRLKCNRAEKVITRTVITAIELICHLTRMRAVGVASHIITDVM